MSRKVLPIRATKLDLHVRAGEFFQRVETETGIFNENRPPDLGTR